MISMLVLVALATTATVFAATVNPETHIAVTAASGIALALAAIWQNRSLAGAGASKSGLSAATGRHLAAAWAWGGLSLFILYFFAFVTWPEWWQFALAFAALAVLAFGFSLMAARDAEAGRDDWMMLNLGRRLTQFQLAGTIIAMVGLLIDGKMHRFLDIRKGWEDWAANNIFFFGALALALISANALWTSRGMKTGNPDAPVSA